LVYINLFYKFNELNNFQEVHIISINSVAISQKASTNPKNLDTIGNRPAVDPKKKKKKKKKKEKKKKKKKKKRVEEKSGVTIGKF